MKDYKLVSEHDKHFLLQHPDSSLFKVAKSGLSPQHIKKVQALAKGGEVEHLADGTPSFDSEPSVQAETDEPSNVGMAQEQPQAAPEQPQQPAFNPPNWHDVADEQDVRSGKNYRETFMPSTHKDDTTEEQAPKKDNPNADSGQNPDIKTVATDTPAPTSSMDALSKLGADNDKAIGSTIDAITKSAQAQQAAADTAAKAYADNSQKMQVLQDYTKQQYSKIDQETNQLQQDVASTKIDPNRVWNSASTGNKILAGIGMLLSGIGSGASGQSNMAMDVLNKTIDRDIEAQKADLGKKENLLSMNYHKYGSLNAATTATALQLNAITMGQVQSAAARAQGPQAQAGAQMAIQQLTMQANNYKMELAKLGMKNDLLNGTVNPGSVPPSLIEGMGLTSRVVNTPKGPMFAKTPEEAQKTQAALTSYQKIDSLLNDAVEFQKTVGATLPTSAQNDRANSIQKQIVQELGHLANLNRLNDKELDIRTEQAGNPGSFFQNKALAKNMQLKQFVKEGVQAEMQNNLIGGQPQIGKGTRDVASGKTLVNYKKGH